MLLTLGIFYCIIHLKNEEYTSTKRFGLKCNPNIHMVLTKQSEIKKNLKNEIKCVRRNE